MKNLRVLIPLFALVALLALSACNLTAATQTPGADSGATYTAAVQAVQATQTALALQATQMAIDSGAQSVHATQTALAGGGALPTATQASGVFPTATTSGGLFPTAPALEPTATPLPPTSTPLPTFTPTPTPCTNAGKFTGENWKDDSKILAGQFFTKRWTIQNAGTCTWTTDYRITDLAGGTLGLRDSVVRNWRMPKEVKPGESVDVEIELWAPFANGTFETQFRLVAPNGAQFGVGASGQVPIYARLKSVDLIIPQNSSHLKTDTLNLGDPTWYSDFEKDTWRWSLSLANTSKATFELKDNKLLMSTLSKPATRWMIGSNTHAYTQLVQADFTTGATCSGKDGYGMALRAEDIGGGVYNRAYIFQFTCDGQYRLYYMDGAEKVEIVPFSASPHIKQGPNKTNRMSALILGGKIALFANGEKVLEVKNQIPGDNTGIYGLMITTSDTDKLQVYVDDFKLWILDKWLK
jgi:hypothetical protein